MDARDFDDLVTRISGIASRRETLLGIAGGTLATVGVAAAVEARKKQRGKERNAGKSARSGVTAEQKRKKRKICLCASYEMLECEDKKVKKNKVRKILENNPGSFQGACQPLVNRVPGRDR